MELHHKREGDEGPVMVILHGLFGMSDNWRTIARRLSDQYQVIALDLPNHGRSPWLTTFDLTAAAAAVGEYLASLDLSSYHLVGHSLGGKVAMTMALSQDYPIDHLVVVDIAPRAYLPGHGEVFNALRRTDLEGVSRRGEADERMAEHMTDIGVRQFLLKSLYRKPEGNYGWRFDLDTLERDYANILIPMTTPQGPFDGKTLFIRGGRSRYILDEDMTHIASLFSDAQVQTITDAGHWVHAEQPVAFVEMVRAFLS